MPVVSARLRWLIALVPVFPPLYVISFYSLRYWRMLGPALRKAAAFYLLAQLLAALFTPSPLLSLSLAALRGLFIVSLLLTGALLRDKRWLYYLIIGASLTLVVSFATTFDILTWRFFAGRLMHPYYTVTSLGIAAALTLWLLVSWKSGPLWLRLLLLMLAFTALVMAGSRGAIAGFVAGAVAASLAGERAYLWASVLVVPFLGLRYATLSQAAWKQELGRLFSLSLSGRGQVWERAWAAFLSHPWGGVGPYQLGPWLNPDHHALQPYYALYRLGVRKMPAILEPISGAWLIAHDVFLHSLTETGLLGTAGFLALLLLSGYAVVKARDPLLAAIYFGFLTMGLVDNPTAVPSLFFAEVFWVAAGMALARAGLTVALEQRPAVDVDQLGPDAL